MAIIKSPNADYNGVSASLTFVKGVAETDDAWLIDWFRTHGYAVDDSTEREARQKAERSAEEKAATEAKTKAEAVEKADAKKSATAEAKK